MKVMISEFAFHWVISCYIDVRCCFLLIFQISKLEKPWISSKPQESAASSQTCLDVFVYQTRRSNNPVVMSLALLQIAGHKDMTKRLLVKKEPNI